MRSKAIYRITSTLSLLIVIACIIWIFYVLTPIDENYADYKNPTWMFPKSSSNTKPENPIDFKKLQKKNSDVYAWIIIPDTNVDYPVAQASGDLDDNFYLNHDINKDYLFEGMIYSQRLNNKDFKDFVTIFYGHNMRNGDMFATLHNFEDKDFFKEHQTFEVYTPGHILTYTVVAAYTYDDRHILNTFDFSKKKERKRYIESITSPESSHANVRKDIQITAKSNILTLSTCTNDDSERYLVQSILTDDTLTQ